MRLGVTPGRMSIRSTESVKGENIMSPLNKSQVQQLYSKRARRYDVTANLYYAIGFREFLYRKRAVDALNLHRGDTVVEISCGTGLNFPLLEEAVGPEGHIIGIDLTESMLEQANWKIKLRGWKNIRLLQGDAAAYTFPDRIDGVFSAFAITLIPEYDDIIRKGAAALKPGGRWVVLDFRLPTNRLAFLAPLAAGIMKPFGVTMDLADRHPWESIWNHMHSLSMRDLYGGFAYIAVGTKEAS